MATGGAPIGNQNARKAKVWTQAIQRVLERGSRKDYELLDQLAQALIDKAMEGDLQALKELGDRLEGKPGQSVEVIGDPENPLETRWTVTFVNPSPKDAEPSSK